MTQLPRITDADSIDVATHLNALAAAVEQAIADLGGTPLPPGGGGATGSLIDVDEFRDVLNVSNQTATDATLEQVISAAESIILPQLRAGDYTTNGAVREAALAVAVQVWQARSAPGGQMVGIDLAPMQTPHLLGVGLLARVRGLISPFTHFGGAAVG
jgi:hypothetical protein